jgi:hypothetical protein
MHLFVWTIIGGNGLSEGMIFSNRAYTEDESREYMDKWLTEFGGELVLVKKI